MPAGELMNQELGILALVLFSVVVEQSHLAAGAGEFQNMGADEAGEVEAIVVAVLLPVEAGAALLAGGDDGHLARQLPVCEAFEGGRAPAAS